MNILALDLGTTTGYALDNYGKITSGVKNFKPSKFDSVGLKFMLFRQFILEQFIAKHSLDVVVFEAVNFGTTVYSSQVYGGFVATLCALCEECEINYAGIGVSTIKKFITGRGNANKKMVIASIKELGFKPKDDNEADAIACLLCYKESLCSA